MAISLTDLESQFSLATNSIHVDDRYAGPELAPAMHPTSTFRYPHNPDDLEPQQALSVSILYGFKATVILSRSV